LGGTVLIASESRGKFGHKTTTEALEPTKLREKSRVTTKFKLPGKKRLGWKRSSKPINKEFFCVRENAAGVELKKEGK